MCSSLMAFWRPGEPERLLAASFRQAGRKELPGRKDASNPTISHKKKVHPGIPGKVEKPFCGSLFFFCVPKRRNKKKAPQPVLALRASLTSRRERDAEKLGLRPQTVPASFSAPVCEARQDKWGRGKNSHWHAAEHRRGCRKGDLHCLSVASLQSPGSIEEYPMRGINSGHPAFGGTRDTEGPFFGQAKK